MAHRILRWPAWLLLVAAALWLAVALTFPWWADALARTTYIDWRALPWRWLHFPWVVP